MTGRPQRLTVVHVITDLDTGGAETMLARIVERSDAARFRHVIVSLTTVGEVGAELRLKGFEVSALGLSRRFPSPLVIWRLRRLIATVRPDVVKSWMYYGDLAAALAVGRRLPLIWGVHNLPLTPSLAKRSIRVTARVCAVLSKWIPRRIVLDSQAAAAVHGSIGYDRRIFSVIPNGFDTELFTPDAARDDLRRELGVGAGALIVGLIARFAASKDHQTFLRAAAIVRREVPDAHFVLCGGHGISEQNETLMSWIEELSLRDAVHILGRRDDLPAIMASLDLGVCSSASESFPVAVGELMASGLPCVVTDAGDTRLLAGDTAVVVPIRDAPALGEACAVLLRMPAGERRARGRAARRRIVDHFSIASTVRAYEALIDEVARG
jgi:glycosyltransferase involved in cell wall biosynthesis